MDKKLKTILASSFTKFQGVEREFLRTTTNAGISRKLHPKKLGSTLTNKYITTDFAEPQIEIVAPPSRSERGLNRSLKDLHLFINENLKEELIWPFSMPPKLPSPKEIPIAEYGKSRQGIKKRKYREGLVPRYGAKMQSISGLHYNYSFSEELMKYLYKESRTKKSKQDFINDKYFDVIRNFLKYRCIVTYLFGASPVFHKSFLNKGRPDTLEVFDNETYYGPQATSIRMSGLGYTSKIQKQIYISYNSLTEYIRDLRYAISTPHPKYKDMDGLNSNILQIENEHYTSIRPKRTLLEGETPLEALEKRGVEYVEIRALDIDPFSPTGINMEQIYFMQILLVYCLLKDSPKFSKEFGKKIMDFQNTVSFFGRGLGCNCKEFGLKNIKKMGEIALSMDKSLKGNAYSEVLEKQIKKIKDPSLTPSAKILKEMEEKDESFIEMGLRLAHEHKKYFEHNPLPPRTRKTFQREAERSLKKQKELEVRTEMLTEGYEDMEISTQFLIKEAQTRGVKVEILDRSRNFIKLSKGDKIEYVQQGNKTSKDSYAAFLIMKNKVVTKKILNDAGIRVPKGDHYMNKTDAIEDYEKYKHIRLVVKPKSTNYGISINYVDKNDVNGYKDAVEEALKHDSSIIVEEFIDGKEYRFNVIDGRVVAISHRIPANVIGDGIHTIEDLIGIKNTDPKFYKNITGYHVQMGKTERMMLKSQGLTFKSVPNKGKRIFLRESSNVSQGGDSIDFTNKLPKKFENVAVKAAEAVGAKICGVDMIIKGSSYAIIELNYNPAILLHNLVVEGESRHTERPTLDLLGFVEKPIVEIGGVKIGGDSPIAIQSMTNTDTADVASTVKQIKELADAGAEVIRIAVDTDAAAKKVSTIRATLDKSGYAHMPLVGDFHFNGHRLLSENPTCAAALDKYRINPGNVGQHFKEIIKIAIKNNKPIRIGGNSGSIKGDIVEEVWKSAQLAERLGLLQDKIVLSVKMTDPLKTIEAYRRLTKKMSGHPYALHLGVTEAGTGIQGAVSSTVALTTLLNEGIGDTIRISLTPTPGGSRTEEVLACKQLLQSLGLRNFMPRIISCPGCGRTENALYQKIAKQITDHILKKYPNRSDLTIAIMGCVVNGPGESKQADIGICLPGKGEKPIAQVYKKGRLYKTLRGKNIANQFIDILNKA